MPKKVDFIALYLPQFYPFPENDAWYGKGFTEWTNVTKAKPLFPGHYEPKLPADLGFYDLRVPEVRREQARMAKENGIAAFCYWNYWFGNGYQLLDMPIWEVHNDPSIDFPFCLAWANESWEKKYWDKKSSNELIVEQKYLGAEDYKQYFYKMLPLFRDERYYKFDGKLFFIVYNPTASPDLKVFLATWRELAKKEGLPEFFFVGKDSDCRNKAGILSFGYDAVYDDNMINRHHHMNLARKVVKMIQRKYLGWPTIIKYKDAIRYMVTENDYAEDVIPLIGPNFDHSPRSGRNGFILHDCDPKYFYQIAKKACECAKSKKKNHMVIIKAWNEWGEGNYMEPDRKYGHAYLDVIKRVCEEE